MDQWRVAVQVPGRRMRSPAGVNSNMMLISVFEASGWSLTRVVTVNVPTSAQVDEASSKQIGFALCPFDLTTTKVNDGRNAAMANSAFGTVFGVVDGKPLPVCDYAGFAPFGFGYRRCPGEQLTIQVFEDFL
jgi:hypothetical protein